jgi:hypothetical protein
MAIQLVAQIGDAGPSLPFLIGPPGKAGSAPLNFIVDTGASHTFIAISVLEKLCIKPLDEKNAPTQRPDGGVVKSQKYRISLWTLDGIAINEDFVARSARPYGCSGLIGQDILSKCIMVHDGLQKIATLFFPDVKA